MSKQPLTVTHPSLASEADGWDPNLFTLGSKKKVPWKCQSGHSWEAAIYSRASGNGCPVCAGKKVVKGLNDLRTTHPEIAQEAFGWDPTDFSAGSEKKLTWRCVLGHEWQSPIYNRTKGSGCPFCAGKQAWPGFNDMAKTHPKLAEQANGWDPTKFIAGTAKKLNWKCLKGHEWVASGNSRVSKGSGCPVCSNQITVTGINDLATIHPRVAAEAFGWDPSIVNSGSNAVKSWRCSVSGHEWKSSISNRTRRGDGCPVCSGRKVVSGVNDLATLHPNLADEADGWDPVEGMRFANKRVAWRCAGGHKWKTTVSSRIAGSGCPFCAGQRAIAGVNDLLTLHPELAAQADGWDPSTLMSQSNKKVGWKCVRGHKWKTSVASRMNGTGCPYCSGNLVSVGFNDLATTHPDIAAEAAGWDPTTVSKGSIVKMWWLCPNGHRYKSTPNNRTQGRGCPTCAKTGFDSNSDAWLYFLRHDLWGLLQIGITNVPKARLRYHKSIGWEVLEVRGPMSGDITRQWEQDILHSLKQRGVKLSPDHIAQFSGYTEAWVQEDFPAKSLAELMQLVHDDEQ